MIFLAKKDTLYRIIFYLSFLLTFVFLIQGLMAKEWLNIILMPIIIILLGWVWFKTTYKILNGYLVIAMGPYKKQIIIEEIAEIRLTKNALASLALSCERLEIVYKHFNSVYISPENFALFIDQLLAENGKIKVVDQKNK